MVYELCESGGLVITMKIYSGKTEETDNSLSHISDLDLHSFEDYLDK